MAIAVFFVFCYLSVTKYFIYGAFGDGATLPNWNTAYLFLC